MASVTVARGRQVLDCVGEDADEWQGKWKPLLRRENGIMSQVAKAKQRWTGLHSHMSDEQASQGKEFPGGLENERWPSLVSLCMS